MRTAGTLLLVVVAVAISSPSLVQAKRPSPKDDYRCGACSTLVDIIHERIAIAEKDHPYNVQSRYRLDEKRSVPYSRSEPFLYSLVDPDNVGKWWADVGYLRSDPPVRLVRRSDLNADPRAIFSDSKLKSFLKSIHNEIVESFDEKLVALLKLTKQVPEVKEEFCVGMLKACTTWPVEWPEPLDKMPEPPAPASAPSPAPEQAAAAGSDAPASPAAADAGASPALAAGAGAGAGVDAAETSVPPGEAAKTEL